MTTRGFKEEEVRQTAHLIADVLDNPHDEANLAAVREALQAAWPSRSASSLLLAGYARGRGSGGNGSGWNVHPDESLELRPQAVPSLAARSAGVTSEDPRQVAHDESRDVTFQF
jgi:hypothetical protein